MPGGLTAESSLLMSAGWRDSLEGRQIKLCRWLHQQKGLGSNYALKNKPELRLPSTLS